MRSNDLNAVEQGELRLARRVPFRAVDTDLVCQQPSLAKAISLSIQLSGLADKEVYGALEIDAGHWSRITKGDAHFPVDKLPLLMNLCGNHAPLMWLAHALGYGLVVLKSEAERQRDAALAQLEQERLKNQLLLDVLHGKRVA